MKHRLSAWRHGTSGSARGMVLRALVPMTLVVGASGCASTGATSGAPGGAPAAPPRQMIFNDPSLPTMYSEAARATERSFAQPKAVVQAAARQLFTDYGIPVTVDNPATGQVGNADFYRARQFLGRPMTELLSCGSTITGPNAATYRIFLSMVLTVTAKSPGGSAAGLLLTASARDIAGGASNDRLPCGSTGAIEERFLTALEKKLAGG